MPTKIVLAPGYEVTVTSSFDEVIAEFNNPIRGGAVPFTSTAGGRVLVNPGHVTLIGEEPDTISGGPFGLGTVPSGNA